MKKIKLYRGLKQPYNENFQSENKGKTVSNDYEFYTEDPFFAYDFGEYLYMITVDESLINEELLDHNGDRNLITKNEKTSENELSQDEYLIYTDHEDYKKLIKPMLVSIRK